MNIIIKAIPLKQANKFVYNNHSHCPQVRGHLFSIGSFFNNNLIGVVVVSRPIARLNQKEGVAELTRICFIDHIKNSISFSLSRVFRILKLMGYSSVITYSLVSENSACLKASGFIITCGSCGGKSWHKESPHLFNADALEGNNDLIIKKNNELNMLPSSVCIKSPMPSAAAAAACDPRINVSLLLKQKWIKSLE